MTLLHVSVERGYDAERIAPSIVVSLEILGLVLAWWIGVRR